jgi:hypothetical protein
VPFVQCAVCGVRCAVCSVRCAVYGVCAVCAVCGSAVCKQEQRADGGDSVTHGTILPLALHTSPQHCLAQHCTALHSTAMPCTALHSPLHSPSLHTSLHTAPSPPLHCTALHTSLHTAPAGGLFTSEPPACAAHRPAHAGTLQTPGRGIIRRTKMEHLGGVH